MRLGKIVAVLGVFCTSAAAVLWLGWPDSGETARLAWRENFRGSLEVPTRHPERLSAEAARLEQALAAPNAVLRCEAVLPLLSGLAPSLLPRATERLLQLQRGTTGWEAVELSLVRLSQLDLARAVRLAAAAENLQVRRMAIRSLFLSLTPAESARALTLLSGELHAFADAARHSVDPELAIAEASGRPDSAAILGGAFEKLVSRIGGPAAVRRAESMPLGPQRTQSLRGAVRGWALQEPIAALAWAKAHDTPKEGLYFTALIPAAALEPAAAAEFVLRQPRAADREDRLQSVARSWWQQDPERALTWVRGLNKERDQRAAALGLVDEWTQIEPAAAVALALKLELAAPDGESLLQRAASAWAAQDPASAGTWLRGLPRGPNRDRALAGFVQGSLNSTDDAHQLLQVLGSLEVGPEVSGSVFSVVRRLAETDFEAAVVWSLEAPDRTLASPLFAELATRRGRTDLAGAIALLDAWFARSGDLPGRTDSSLIVAIDQLTTRWAAQDPAAAARWAAALPQDARHGSIGAHIAAAWAGRDARAAVAWYGAPNAPMQADALRMIFRQITPADPNAALALAASLPVGDLRRIALRSIRVAWMNFDQNAATAWMVRDKPDLAAPSLPFQLRYGGGDDEG